jgi:hypothetical protein
MKAFAATAAIMLPRLKIGLVADATCSGVVADRNPLTGRIRKAETALAGTVRYATARA